MRYFQRQWLLENPAIWLSRYGVSKGKERTMSFIFRLLSAKSNDKLLWKLKQTQFRAVFAHFWVNNNFSGKSISVTFLFLDLYCCARKKKIPRKVGYRHSYIKCTQMHEQTWIHRTHFQGSKSEMREYVEVKKTATHWSKKKNKNKNKNKKNTTQKFWETFQIILNFLMHHPKFREGSLLPETDNFNTYWCGHPNIEHNIFRTFAKRP